jgi:hypothetical protein
MCGPDIIWGMSNAVILKLHGVCRTPSCDPPRSLEITWGLKMSKLLNLIAYSLACLLTCTNCVFSCICECLQSTCLESLLLPFRWCLASLYILVLIERGVLYWWWTCLTSLFTLFHILAHDYLLVISLWSLLRINSCFCKSWHNDWV